MGRETAFYTHGHHASVLRSHRWRTAANSAAYMLEEIASDASVLDIGCGPGTISADFAEVVPSGHVVAVDASSTVLREAEAAAGQRGLRNIEFRVGDVHGLDFGDGAFDVVHAHQLLQHVGEPVAALREMRRVCAARGVVAARDADYGGMFWHPQLPGLEAWRDLYRRVARANGGEPDAGRRLHAWAREAGFREIGASAGAWCYASAEERQWWGELWAERIVESDFARSAVDGRHASVGELRRMGRAWQDWAGDEDGWFVVPHGEVVCRG
ncbi:methyltransferase domain-containing protein [Streptomyces xiaopingdaonensis]|uniref:methyltransferase domain-containing protein n=1 Tax=Streptomyces xiaopingdaonensis TaxID=1565415 RepID=UPI000493E570|nr:methyltransferase domain-containing protein [Streptomyces xiaopingdaonensis]